MAGAVNIVEPALVAFNCEVHSLQGHDVDSQRGGRGPLVGKATAPALTVFLMIAS